MGRPNAGYFAVAATVLPVLFLAIVFEQRTFLSDEERAVDWFNGLLNIAMILGFAVGEEAALGALRHGPRAHDDFIVGLTLFYALALLLWPLITVELRAIDRSLSPRGQRFAGHLRLGLLVAFRLTYLLGGVGLVIWWIVSRFV